MNLPNFLIPCDIQTERGIIIEELQKKLPNYEPLRGDDFNVLMDCFLYRLNKYINYINYTISQNYLEFSSAEYLDALVKLAGIERFKGTPFIATLQINATAPLHLPKGTKFIDLKGHNAFLIEDVSIDATLKAICEVALQEGLEGDFDTNHLEIPHIYVKSIEKLTAFTQTQTPESDEALKKRFLLSLTRPSTAGSLKSYQYLASIAEVSKSKIKHKDLGVVAVIYQASSESALNALKESIEPNIPLTDTIIYIEATPIAVELNITLKLKTIANIANIINQINSQVKSLFETLEIEEELNISKIIAIAFVSEDIEDIKVSELPQMQENGIYKLVNLKILDKEV